MKRLFVIVMTFVLLPVYIAAQAAVNIETVLVGDPGNVAATAELSGNPAGQGAVSYAFRIGKYEVTAGQYCAFLNAVAKNDTYGLYSTRMWDDRTGCKIQRTGEPGNYIYTVASDYADRPVNFVSFWDACRFANWLHNGQPSGNQDASTTEDGAYTINGYNGYEGYWIRRNANWKWAVTSEDEWFKAAYYKGGGPNAGYWLYPTRSNSAPSNRLMNPDPGNSATYYDENNGYTIGYPYYRTVVGAHKGSYSAYGTFDQCGNVWEWNEAVVHQLKDFTYRGLRGGSYDDEIDILESSLRNYAVSTIEYDIFGFRVSQAVPEPSSIVAVVLGSLAVLFPLRKRKA